MAHDSWFSWPRITGLITFFCLLGIVVTPLAAEVIFSETFEAGWGGWSADNGIWGVGKPLDGPLLTVASIA